MSNKDTPKKILWLTSSYPRFKEDSASIFLQYLADTLSNNNFDINILSPDHYTINDLYQKNLIKNHHFCYFLPRRLQKLTYGSGILPNLQAHPWLFLQIPFFLTALFFSSWQLIRQLKPDLIHAHWIFPQGTIAVLLGKLTNTPVIVTAHGGDAFALQGTLLAKIKQWTIKNCQSWTSNTLATCKAVGNDLPQPDIIPMGIDYPLFSSGQSVKKSQATFVLLFVGRLVKKKGAHDLISAFSLLSSSLLNKTELWIVGDGTEREELKALTESLNLADKVIFYGKVQNSQLPDYYASADIFIAPSMTDSLGDTEGQGVILLEAMASNCAIISTRTGGISEIITHNKNGILVAPQKPGELKNAIEYLLNNSEIGESLGKEAKNDAQFYDWKHIGKIFSALYEKTISNWFTYK